ncbi:MAG TPA: helix-turn-helix domain-containing protein [Streptosporangiaceae bacterium]|nr:helix-turn-helix domain-containing protein [Streptosporangiaceae bacterium]
MSDEGFRRNGLPDPGKVDTREDFARELTLLRERAGLTVRDVAKAAGIPDSTVGGYFGGRHLPPLKPPDLLRNILEVCGVHDPAGMEEWLEALSRVRRAPGKRPADAPVPYRGLASFQPEDADWFYGRQKLIDVVAGHLRDQYLSGGVLIAVGPSGSGKSSLLRAGLIPALRSGVLGVPGSAAWPVALFTPGARPVRELAAQLAPLTAQDAAHLTGSLLSSPACCGELIRQAGGMGEASNGAQGSAAGLDRRRLFVVVDQFEEVFTACPDEPERQAFIAALCAAAGPCANHHGCSTSGSHGIEPAALVVLGLRADFYPHALRYPELVPALQDRQVLVGPMTEAELRCAIVEPARKARLDIEDGLVEVLLRDLTPTPALPLLSHALLTTWERARRGRLTVADYRDTGGIQGAVASTAEQVFGELTSAQRDMARQIFIRLVHVADDTADTRRRVSRNELLVGDEDAQRVLDLFIERRLVTAETDEVEIAHEALLSAWPRLRGWIDADRGSVRIHRQLSSAAEIWRDADRDPNVLYRGGRLATASDWAALPAHHADLNTLEREFLDASIKYRVAEEHAARRRTRRLQRLVAALAALSLVVGFLAVFAFRQKAAATYQRDLAISRQVAIDANQLRSTDIALAIQLSLVAYRIAPTPEVRSSLLDAYSTPAVTRIIGPPGVMQAVAVTPNGTTLAAGGENSTIRLWSLAHPGRPVPLGRPLTGDTNTVFSLAFNPNGKTLASGSEDKTVRLWNVTNPKKTVPWGPPLTGPANTVYSVAFSPDGKILAVGSADGTVRLWNVSDPRHPVSLGAPLTWPHSGYVQSVAFSPDGHLLAAGSAGISGIVGGSVRLWDVTDPSHAVPAGPVLTGPTDKVFSVAFSPDSRTLAAGSADDTVRLWDIADPRHPAPDGAPLRGPTSWVNSVAFSPDGLSLAAGSSDSNVWIWDLATRHVTMTLPHPAPVTTVLFLHNSDTLATSAADGEARIWRIPGPVISGETGPFFTAAFAGDHIMAVATGNNTARLWNVADPRQPVPLGPVMVNAARSRKGTGSAALSPDGDTLVVGAADGTCQVWDVRNPADPVALERLRGPTKAIESIAFSPNGGILAITSDDKTTRLWDMTDPAHPVRLATITGPSNYVYSAAFSPNGRILAAGSASKLIYLWNITNPRRPVPLGRPLAGSQSYVYSVAFSPDGHTLAAGGADDDIRLWNVTDPRRPARLGPPLTGPTNYVYSVAFSPDGRTLAATAGDGSIWLWNVTSLRQPSLLATLAGPAGAVFTGSFGSTGAILATGGSGNLVQFWDTSTDQVAAYVCATAGDRITRSEWRKYIPGLPYDPPC